MPHFSDNSDYDMGSLFNDYQNLLPNMLNKLYREMAIGSADFTPKYPYERLGQGYELRPIEIKDEKGNVIPNKENYSNLYLNDEKVNDMVFRKGGMSGKFIDGYCELIYYVKDKKSTSYGGFNFGTHVIINSKGEIALKGTGISSYPHHLGGNLGKIEDDYYNLLTGEQIMTTSSSGTINSQNVFIFEHRYNWCDKVLPLGVYMLDKTTCEYRKIDDIKK